MKDIIKNGEVLETYSMVQAEETHNKLLEYVEDIKADGDTLELVSTDCFNNI